MPDTAFIWLPDTLLLINGLGLTAPIPTIVLQIFVPALDPFYSNYTFFAFLRQDQVVALTLKCYSSEKYACQ